MGVNIPDHGKTAFTADRPKLRKGVAMQRAGVSYGVSILVAVVVMAVLGMVMQLAMRRLVVEQNLTSLMIVTLGFGYVLQGAAAKAFGAPAKPD